MTIRATTKEQLNNFGDLDSKRSYIEAPGLGATPVENIFRPRLKDFETFESGAEKETDGKLMMELVPSEMVEGLAAPLTYGAQKYAPHNWEKGIPFMKSYGAAMRHLLKWRKGVDIDLESGLKHIEQAMLNLGMIVTQTKRNRVDLDDRPVKGTK